MFKRVLSIFLAFLIMVSTLLASGITVAAAAPVNTVDGILFSKNVTGSSITVDGIVNESNWNLDKPAANLTEGTSSNNTMVFDTAWDDINFYVALKVTDSNVVNNNNIDNLIWNDDTIELFFDGDNLKNSSYDGNDNQIFIRAADNRSYTPQGRITGSAITHHVTMIEDGYIMEVAVSWASLGITPKEGVAVGFDIANDDCDTVAESAPRDSAITWNNTAGDNYRNPSHFGTAILYKKNTPIISTEATPTVDGGIDETEWHLDKSIISGNNTITFGTLCDPDYLYVAVKVLDDSLVNDPANNAWDNDSVEIFLDGDNNKGTSKDSHDMQISVNWNSADFNTTANGIKKALKNITGGYTLEVAVPWGALNITPQNGRIMGFDLVGTDNDGDVATKGWGAWCGTGDNWRDTSSYGSLIIDNANIVRPVYTGPRGTLTDETDDFTKVFDKTASVSIVTNINSSGAFDSTSKFQNGWADNQYVIYRSAGQDILSFDIEAIEMDAPLDLYVSADNITYTKLNQGINYQINTLTPAAGSTGWYAKNEYRSLSIPQGTMYIKIAFTADHSNGYKSNIERVSFDYKAAYTGPTLTFVDTADDMSKLYSYTDIYISSNNSYNTSKFFTWTANGSLTYRSPSGSILNFSMEAIEGPGFAADPAFKVYASADNRNFTQISMTSETLPKEGGEAWFEKKLYTAVDVPWGTNYIRIDYMTAAENSWAASVSTVTFDCVKVNQLPVMPMKEYNTYTTVGAIVSGTLQATDPDEDTLSYSITPQAINGTAVIDSATGNWTYTPNADFVGNDSFVAEVSDGQGGKATTKVNVLVNYVPTNLTYYVDAINGSDSNDGLSSGHAFKTLKAAADLTKPGDTVYIMNGNYYKVSSEGALEINRSGLPNSYITYKPYPGHNPVIHTGAAWGGILVTASYIKIDGLTIIGNHDNTTSEEAQAVYDYMVSKPANTDWAYVGTTNAVGVNIRPASGTQIFPHHIEVTNCDISKCDGGGIGASHADYIIFRGNKVYDNCKYGIYGGSGISVYESNDIDNNTTDYKTIIENNISYNNYHLLPWYVVEDYSDGNGIIIDDNMNTQGTGITPYKGKTLVANNIVYGNGGSGIHAFMSANVDIVNNTAYMNNVTVTAADGTTYQQNWGQIYANSVINGNVLNNILYCQPGKKVNETYGNTNVTYDYNIYYNGATPLAQGTHDIIADPRFVDAANYNFALRSDSPAVNAGTTTLAPTVDILGTSRPVGSGIDIGAYELIYTPTPQLPQQPPATPAPTPAPTPTPANTTIEVKPDLKGTVAEVKPDAAALANAFEQAKPNEDGVKTVVIQVKEVEGAKEYLQQLPADLFTGAKPNEKEVIRELLIQTPVGTIIVPDNMFKTNEVKKAESVGISLGVADLSNLTTAIKEKIGNKPVIEITASVDGKAVQWKNEKVPVVISIDYTPTAEELKNPEHIVVWYIDGNGKAIPVPSGRYDAATGKVTFTTTHFSKYAVAYVKKTFSDINKYPWIVNPVEVLASKGIVEDTSDMVFSPDKPITRGEFIMWLVKTLGLAAEYDGNFSDVKKTDKYYDELGVAKALGIASGGGNNTYSPEKQLSRQDMMVLTIRALKACKKNLSEGNANDIKKFVDSSKVAKYAVENAATMVKNGLINGNGKKLNPTASTTRAEAAQLLFRLYNLN